MNNMNYKTNYNMNYKTNYNTNYNMIIRYIHKTEIVLYNISILSISQLIKTGYSYLVDHYLIKYKTLNLEISTSINNYNMDDV